MTSPPPDEFLRRLDETRERLEAQIEALQNQIRGIELAYQALGGRVAALERHRRHRAARGDVKAALLDLLQEAGRDGLNAQSAVRIAAARGIELDRNTVSSLLSRLKHYGIAVHDGEKYRLAERKPANSPQFEGFKGVPA